MQCLAAVKPAAYPGGGMAFKASSPPLLATATQQHTLRFLTLRVQSVAHRGRSFNIRTHRALTVSLPAERIKLETSRLWAAIRGSQSEGHLQHEPVLSG